MTTQRTPADTPPEDASASPAPFAAAVYVPRTPRGDVLPRFIEALKVSGVKVGGLLQEEVLNADGSHGHIDTIDIATGRRIVINHSTRATMKNSDCSLDVSALTETTSILRQAVDNGAELVVVEKFAAQEAKGGGLASDILEVIAAGTPLLVAVPETSFEAWQERTGGLGARLRFDEQSFHDWWATLVCG
jgi:nucleoside-triphosphatase THEP1